MNFSGGGKQVDGSPLNTIWFLLFLSEPLPPPESVQKFDICYNVTYC